MSRRKIFMSMGSSSTLNNGLISYWKLEGNSNDSIGTHNGTDYGNTYGTGKVGNGALFNGSSRIEFGDLTELSSVSEFSISTWFYINSGLAGYPPIFNKWTFLSNGSFMIRATVSGDFQLFICDGIFDGGSNHIDTISSGITTGNWYHLALVYNGALSGGTNRAKIYLNGILQSSSETGAIPPTTTNGTATFELGKFFTDNLDGKIDEVGVWDRAINGAEISELYNSGSGKTYPF